MKIQELRIGNYVQMEGYPDTIWQVDLTLMEDVSLGLLCIEGIPLTEEWLVKFGFENREGMSFSNCDIFELWDLRILVNRSYKDFAFTHKRMSPPSWSICYVEYVHQLQNLFFSLVGEDLTIS